MALLGSTTYGRGDAPCWIVVPLRGETAQHRAKPCPLIPSDRHPVLPRAIDQGQQERAALVAGFTDGGNVDGGVVLDGTLMLADTAADALDWVDERAFELESCTPAVGDLDVAGEDGLGADRADLLADDATC